MLLSGMAACQQKQSSDTKVKNQKNKMLDIYKQVKTYNYNPWYEVAYSSDACGYEILINDIPLHRYFLFSTANQQTLQINDHILSSGKQNITIRMFPPQLSDKSWSPTLTDAAKFSIKIQHRQAGGPIESAKQVFEFTAPHKPGTDHFLASGQKYYEFKGAFEAEVPYKLEGWGNSKDLSKENQQDLLKEAVEAYNSFRDVLIQKDVDVYAALMYDKETELAKAYYWATPEDSGQRWNEMKGNMLEKREILPLKDFKMVLYAGGKVLALQPTSEMYKDFLSAIHAQTADDDIQVSFFLHKKAGSDKLTPIR